MPTTLHAASLLTPDGPLPNQTITIADDGAIASIEPGPGDPAGTLLAPAFLDIHIHGAAGHDVMEATPEALTAIGRFLATRGVAHYLATTVTAPLDPTLRALEHLANTIESAPPAESTAIPIGIHLEGPFLSHAKRGVHPTSDLREPSIPLFDRFWQAARGHIRLLTLAPELPGALELCRYATDRGVRVSLGHSDATAAETRAALAAGAASATHTFNAMRRLDHREPGIAGVVLDSSELFAELICDGIHVAPEFVRLWWQAKGPQPGHSSPARAILITDGISATGCPDGDYDLGGLTVTVREGRCLLASDLARGAETLAGSVLTLDRAVQNLRRFTAAPLRHALQAATYTPARLLGLDRLTEIAPGRPANLNLFAPDGALLQTWLGGRTLR